MGHTPFGYKIENGIAVIDQPAADKLRQLYKNYLSGRVISLYQMNWSHRLITSFRQ